MNATQNKQAKNEMEISIEFYIYKLWNERGFGKSYLTKLSFQELRSLFDEEFESEF